MRSDSFADSTIKTHDDGPLPPAEDRNNGPGLCASQHHPGGGSHPNQREHEATQVRVAVHARGEAQRRGVLGLASVGRRPRERFSGPRVLGGGYASDLAGREC